MAVAVRSRRWVGVLCGAAIAWLFSSSCSPTGASTTTTGGGGGSSGADATSPQPASSHSGSASDQDATTVDSGGTPEGPETGATSSTAGCGAGETSCGGSCVNLATSFSNCGGCGQTCTVGKVCQGGSCGCATGQVTCSGACVDTTSDARNCGACGAPCPTGMVCSQSKCASGCSATLTLCGSSCVDTTGNSQDCGGCGKICPSDQSCWMGACTCAPGLGACGTSGACVDIMASADHCGGCTACPTGGACTAGVCACPTGQTVCSGACVDLNTDPQNCGACAAACTVSGTQCLYGGCVDPSSVNCGTAPMVGYTCTAYGAVTMGKYWVNNNEWGVNDAGGGGQQCVWGTCEDGDLVGWATNWSWTTGPSNTVKSYASIVFGWQWGWKVANTGLPVQISTNPTVNCGWDFTLAETSGTLDVSYDTWLHAIANPGATDTPTEEVMVWLYTGGGAGPIGDVVAQGVSLAGTTWDLHQGAGAAWQVSSYVRTGNATTAVMNMMVFYNDLVTRGWIPNTRYLSSIQAGTEVFNGTSTLTTNGFYCRVQ